MFNVVKEGLPCFTVLKTVEKEMIYGFNVTFTNTNGIYCVVNTMLWTLKPRRNLVNSFLPYVSEISKKLLGKSLINSKSLFKKFFFQNFLLPGLVYSTQLLKSEKKSF